MSVRKILVVAGTEFGTAVRSKSFILGLLLLPILMGLSIGIQAYLAERVDTRTRAFAVIDRTGALYPTIETAAAAYNKMAVDENGKPRAPRLEPRLVAPGSTDLDPVRLDLSDQVRAGKLFAFVEIPENALDPGSGPILYHSDTPNDGLVRNWLVGVVGAEVRARRFQKAGIDQQVAERLNSPVLADNLGLLDRSAAPATAAGPAGAQAPIRAAEKVDQIRTFGIPAVLLFVMFFVIMSSAPHLLNSVLEEKMNRVSEVLLGSTTPFELMMGKLLGNVGIASVLALCYVGGSVGVAVYNGYGDVVTPGLLAILALFIVLAVMLYGSLYMAVGSACSELKDAQSLMMPVLLLSMLPMFVWSAVLQDPSSPLAVGMSLFPPATPYLMPMRMVLHPSAPVWQVGLSILLTLLAAVACVFAAGKIFRTGILMHGKPPSFRELARWVLTR